MRAVLSYLFALVILGTGPGLANTLTLAPGEPLTAPLVERLIDRDLTADVEGRLRVEIDEPRLPLANHSEATTEIRLDGLDRHPRTGRFTGTLSGTTDDGRSFALALRGSATDLIEVPVVGRRVDRHERIGESDLDWLEVPADRLPQGALVHADQLVGHEAKRPLAARRVLTARDVGQPLLVRRHQPVRLRYIAGDLTISTVGTAQEDGAAGALVRVVNRDSRRHVEGLVTGPDEVTVAEEALQR